MTPAECLRLLTLAAQYDPRALPSDPDDQRTKAAAWAQAINAHHSYAAAQQAVINHYRRNTDTVTVADVNGTPLPPGYYTAEQLEAGVGIHPAPNPDRHTKPCGVCGSILRSEPPFEVPEASHNGNHPACLGDAEHSAARLPAPCGYCGRHWVHDTRVHANGAPVCPHAPGRVTA